MCMLDGGFTDPRKHWGVTLPSGPKQVLDPKVNPDPFDSIDVGGGGSIGWGRFIF